MGAISSQIDNIEVDTLDSIANRGSSTTVAITIGDGSALQSSDAPINPEDISNKQYVDDEVASVVYTDTDTLDIVTGRGASTANALTIGDGSALTSAAAPVNPEDISNKQYVDDAVSEVVTVELDPVFSASEAASITSTDTTNWDTAYSHSQITTGNPHNVDSTDVGADPAGTASSAVSGHELSYNHSDIAHTNRAQLDLVSDGDHDVRTDNPHGTTYTQVGADAAGTAAGVMSSHTSTYAHGNIAHTNRIALDAVTGTNTGDEPSATETVEGVAEIATQTEVNTGSDDSRIVTAAKAKSIKSINISLAGANPYLDADNAAYTVLNRFYFKGSNLLGTPATIKLIAAPKTANKYSDFRIYDATNAAVVAELLNLTGSVGGVFVLYNMGTISNIPTAEAIFELQGRNSAVTGGIGWVSGITVNW